MRPEVIQGDVREVLKTLDDESVQCVVTSPPYWGLRDYGVDDQLGLEATPEAYVANMVAVFQEVKRVLRKDGTLWLNLGDSYSSGGRETTTNQTLRGGKDYGVTRPKPNKSIKPKDLIGIPWRVALALQADGWYLRSDIIWNKPNPMPESCKDRPTKAHEYIFLLTKSAKYYYDADAIKEPQKKILERPDWLRSRKVKEVKDAKYKGKDNPRGGGLMRRWLENPEKFLQGRNKRSVWRITTKPYKEAHFATFPEELPETCIKAGTKKGDVVLDIFAGSGTTLRVASKLGRKGIGIELNPEYIKILKKRCKIESMSLDSFC
jgi:DNA modification methylase